MEKTEGKSTIECALESFGICADELDLYLSPSRCSVYKAVSGEQQYGIKCYPREYGVHELLAEIKFVNHLWSRGLSVPHFLTCSNGDVFFSSPDGTSAAAYEWIDGETLTIYDERRLQFAVAAIASIHHASINFNTFRSDEWLWKDTMSCLAGLDPPREIVEWLRNVAEAGRPWQRDSRLYVCHNDYSLKNTIWNGNGRLPFFIDFTNTICSPFEWDLAVFCADLQLSGAYKLTGKGLITKVCDLYMDCGSVLVTTESCYQLFMTAIVQRAVFRAFTQPAPTRQNVWQILQQLKTTEL